MLILPEMHGTDLTFKTGGMDNCDCVETLNPTADGNLDARLLITHA